MPRKRKNPGQNDPGPGSHPPLTASIVYADRELFGLREVDTLGCLLQVRAAPWAERDRLRSWRPLDFITYVIDGPAIYTGHGNGDRQIGDRLTAPQSRSVGQVYVIHSLDDRFDKRRAAYLESRLIDIADDLGVPLANKARPFGYDGIWPSEQEEQLVRDADFLLSVAGFRRFEDARAGGTVSRTRLAVCSTLDDAEFIEPDEFVVPADAVLQRLACGFAVTGFAGADERFWVLPGADWPWENRPGLSVRDIRRRKSVREMELVEPAPGASDHGRLRPGVRCRSAAAAAALVSGKPLRTVAWKRIDARAGEQ